MSSADDEPFGLRDRPENLRGTSVDGVTTYRDVQYDQPWGYRPLLLDLSIPESVVRPPLVVIIHGGAWMMGSIKRRHGDPELLHEGLLAAGFAVAYVQYRLSGEAHFPAQVLDLRTALRWLVEAGPELGFDSDRLATLGDSAGGHLALLLGSNIVGEIVPGDGDEVAAAPHISATVAWYPPTALDRMDEHAIPESLFSHDAADSPESLLLGVSVADNRTIAHQASPAAYVTSAHAPTLLVHGDQDRIVAVGQSLLYRDLLATALVPHELVIEPGADHMFGGVELGPIVERTVAWLTRTMP